MAKDEKSKAGGPKAGKASQAAVVPATAVGEPKPRITEKEYQRELRRMHGEVVAMQEWVKATGAKVCIVFEGRDGAGKGGVIKAITERVSPRVFRLVALPAPSDRERTQMYIQRYLPHFPAGGEVVIFDRSWYNRAGVERVMGFTAMDQVERFLAMAPGVEKAMVDSGILLFKYWLEVSPRGADPPPDGSDRRRAQDLEAQPDGRRVLHPLGRLHDRQGRHVRGHQHVLGAMVRRKH